MFIGGTNCQNNIDRGDGSYYFSAINHVWGWASWRRAWVKYQYDTNSITHKLFKQSLKYYFPKPTTQRYWLWIFDKMRKHQIDTWDYQLGFSIWINKGLSIIPNKNLVSNIGFGEGATHTFSETDPNANRCDRETNSPV